MTDKTLRQQIIELLEDGAMDARELSTLLGVKEKDIYDHLAHVERTATSNKRRFLIHPSHCIACGFRFEKRKRLTRPGKCPQCRSSRLSQPFFEIR